MVVIDTIDISDIIRERVRITVFAYAYEIISVSLISDKEYDKLSLEVDKRKHIPTGNLVYDKFFANQFDASTGMWIRNHPDCFDGKLDFRVRYLIKYIFKKDFIE